MGLFGSKKTEKEVRTAKITDFFSEDDLQKIRELVEPKAKNREYKKYNELAENLVKVVNESDTEYTPKSIASMTGPLFSAAAMTKMEPSLKPMLDEAIKKMQAFKKG